MVLVRGSLLPLLLAVLGRFDPVHATAVADLLDASQSSLYSAFHLLNATVGGRLRIAVPFENACFSTVEGQHVNVSAAACATLHANYTNPVYRVDYFGAYMLVSFFSHLFRSITDFAHLRYLSPQPQWETCQASNVTNGCLLDSGNVSNPLAFDGVNCRLGNVPPFYVSAYNQLDHFFSLSLTICALSDQCSFCEGCASCVDVFKLDWCTIIGQEQGPRLQGSFQRPEYPRSVGEYRLVGRDF